MLVVLRINLSSNKHRVRDAELAQREQHQSLASRYHGRVIALTRYVNAQDNRRVAHLAGLVFPLHGHVDFLRS